MSAPAVDSAEIQAISLHRAVPVWFHLYVLPFLVLYPLAGYAYFVRYDDFIADQANTFIGCVVLLGLHALSWLATRWSVSFRAAVTAIPARRVQTANLIKIIPVAHRGQPEFTPLQRTAQPYGKDDLVWFSYQRDKYTYTSQDHTFAKLSFPCDSGHLTLGDYRESQGITSQHEIDKLQLDFGKNVFDIPIPTFRELFAEHAQAPFFVFQIFCVGLWCLDEYWYYSIFTLFMLIMFECTVVFQRQRTLNEFRTMSIKPYNINVYRSGSWSEIKSDDLLPGDVVSVGELPFISLVSHSTDDIR